jgi:hypothetical protein
MMQKSGPSSYLTLFYSSFFFQYSVSKSLSGSFILLPVALAPAFILSPMLSVADLTSLFVSSPPPISLSVLMLDPSGSPHVTALPGCCSLPWSINSYCVSHMLHHILDSCSRLTLKLVLAYVAISCKLYKKTESFEGYKMNFLRPYVILHITNSSLFYTTRIDLLYPYNNADHAICMPI